MERKERREDRERAHGKNERTTPKKRSSVLYGVLCIALAVAVMMSVQFFGPSSGTQAGGTDEGAFAGATQPAIVLNDLVEGDSGTGWVYSGTTLTFDTVANGHMYEITQTGAAALPRNVVFLQNVETDVTITDINITGDTTLTVDAVLNLFISGTNTIGGSIHVPVGTAITIDSASAPGTGSSVGSLKVTAAEAGYAAIGGIGADVSSGTIIIAGGDVEAYGGGDAGIGTGGGAGIGGSGGHNGGVTTITGGKV
jgi:hypothetical protein